MFLVTIWLWCQERWESGIPRWHVAPGLSMAAHWAMMLHSAGAGLHQPHSVVHISALPRGVELSSAAQVWCAHGCCVCWCCPESAENGSKEWSWNPGVILCLIQVYWGICASLTKAVPRGISHQSHQGTADHTERAGWSRKAKASQGLALRDCWQYVWSCSVSPGKAAFVSRCLGIKAALGNELLQRVLMCAMAGKEMSFVWEQKALTVSCASLSCLITCHGLLGTGFSVHNQSWQWGNVAMCSTDTS